MLYAVVTVRSKTRGDEKHSEGIEGRLMFFSDFEHKHLFLAMPEIGQ